MSRLYWLSPCLLSISLACSATDLVSESFSASAVLVKQQLTVDMNGLLRRFSKQNEGQGIALQSSDWTTLSGRWQLPPETKGVTAVFCTAEPVAEDDPLIQIYGLTKVGEQSGTDVSQSERRYNMAREGDNSNPQRWISPIRTYYLYRIDFPASQKYFSLPPIASLERHCTSFTAGNRFAFLADLEAPGRDQCGDESSMYSVTVHFTQSAAIKASVPGIQEAARGRKGGGVLCCTGSCTEGSDEDEDDEGGNGSRLVGQESESNGGDGGDKKQPFSNYEKKIKDDDPLAARKREWIATFKALIAQGGQARDSAIKAMSSALMVSSLSVPITLISWAQGHQQTLGDEYEQMQQGETTESMWTFVLSMVVADLNEEGVGMLIDHFATLPAGAQMGMRSAIQKVSEGSEQGRDRQDEDVSS